jgi:hypothetical protein
MDEGLRWKVYGYMRREIEEMWLEFFSNVGGLGDLASRRRENEGREREMREFVELK